MKHRFIAKKFWKDRSTAMGASNELAKSFDDVINFSLGDPDRITDRAIIDSTYRDTLAGHTKYTEFRGDPELREEVRKYYKEEFDMDVDDSEVFITAAGCIGMYLALTAILDPGDEVILQAPYFTPYPTQVGLAGGIPVEMPTYEEEDFQVNVERLESLINERTKALIINTPNNPTGTCLTVDTMKDIARVAEEYDLVVICDDIYTAFSYQNPFVPFASLPGMRDRTIVINTFSKDFTMTGWRVGDIIAPSFIIDVIQQANEGIMFTAPSVSQRAAIYALRERKRIQPPMIADYKERMYHTAERINRLSNMHVLYPPKGSFYLFPNIKDTGLTSAEAADLILREAHVLTLPGSAFGACGEGFLRLACTVGCDEVDEAFDRIEKIDIFAPKK
jgi:aspartate/methionine/tyrosine aminotransferase